MLIVFAYAYCGNGTAGQQQGFDDGRFAGAVVRKYGYITNLIACIFFERRLDEFEALVEKLGLA